MIATGLLMFVEFAAGDSNSLALISDATHMFTDLFAMGVSLFAVWLSSHPKTLGSSFGLERAEILGALFNGLLIWLLTGFLVYEAIERFDAPP